MSDMIGANANVLQTRTGRVNALTMLKVLFAGIEISAVLHCLESVDYIQIPELAVTHRRSFSVELSSTLGSRIEPSQNFKKLDYFWSFFYLL